MIVNMSWRWPRMTIYARSERPPVYQAFRTSCPARPGWRKFSIRWRGEEMPRPSGMEGRVARTGFMTAGFALSAVLMVAASCDAAPPRAAKAIAPPKPEMTTKTAAPPQPKSEPQIVPTGSHPSPRPRPASSEPPRKTQPVRSARHTRHGGVAQNARPYHYGGQPSLRSPWQYYDGERRPASGPVYEANCSIDDGCDEACRYRAWFRDYSAWYQAYGRRYSEYPPAPRGPDASSIGDGPRTAYRPDEVRVRNERDRLDPWHGYNDHDGPQNGY